MVTQAREGLGVAAKDIILAPVKPLVTPEQAAQEWALFEALKQKILVEDDYQAIAGKRYIKRSGFRKIAVYFGLGDRILEQERLDREDGSFTWRFVVEACAPNLRVCTGVGVCDSRERGFAHVEHDVYATAHTRAKSRAISDMVAGGAISAEEVDVGEQPPQPPKRGKPEAKPKRKAGPEPGLKPGVQESEDWVRDTLVDNDVDTAYLMVTVYGDVIRVEPQEGYNEVGWVDDQKVITQLLKGTWVPEKTRWEVPVTQ